MDCFSLFTANPFRNSVLATAGGVVFAGALNRWLNAYDDASGTSLWKLRLNDVPNSAPITYTANGKQYVAVVVGYAGAQAASFPQPGNSAAGSAQFHDLV